MLLVVDPDQGLDGRFVKLGVTADGKTMTMRMILELRRSLGTQYASVSWKDGGSCWVIRGDCHLVAMEVDR